MIARSWCAAALCPGVAPSRLCPTTGRGRSQCRQEVSATCRRCLPRRRVLASLPVGLHPRLSSPLLSFPGDLVSEFSFSAAIFRVGFAGQKRKSQRAIAVTCNSVLFHVISIPTMSVCQESCSSTLSYQTAQGAPDHDPPGAMNRKLRLQVTREARSGARLHANDLLCQQPSIPLRVGPPSAFRNS